MSADVSLYTLQQREHEIEAQYRAGEISRVVAEFSLIRIWFDYFDNKPAGYVEKYAQKKVRSWGKAS